MSAVAGGTIGAPLRRPTDRAVQTRHDTVLPWGTFSVNAVGSLVLGPPAGLGGVGVGVALAEELWA